MLLKVVGHYDFSFVSMSVTVSKKSGYGVCVCDELYPFFWSMDFF